MMNERIDHLMGYFACVRVAKETHNPSLQIHVSSSCCAGEAEVFIIVFISNSVVEDSRAYMRQSK